MQRTFTIDTADGERSYLVYSPPDATGPLPVVMMIHGAGGTAAWTLAETRWHLTAERERFLVVLPEGTRPKPHAPPNFLHNPQVWNDASGHGEPPRPPVDDVAFLTAVFEDLGRHFPVDAARFYLTGFSNGAGMTFRFAAARSALLAAIAPVAGHDYTDSGRLAYPVPTLYLVGSIDPLVPLAGGEIVTPWGRHHRPRPAVRDTLLRWARTLGCREESVVVHEEDGLLIEQFLGPVRYLAYRVDGLGHHWPGGRGELKRRIAGPPSDRVKACELLWEFFRQHTRD